MDDWDAVDRRIGCSRRMMVWEVDIGTGGFCSSTDVVADYTRGISTEILTGEFSVRRGVHCTGCVGVIGESLRTKNIRARI